MGKVERHVGTPRREDTQHSHHQLRQALGAEAHQGAGTDARTAQPVRQPARAAADLPKVEIPAAERHGDGVRRALRLPGEQLVDAGLRIVPGRDIPARELEGLRMVEQAHLRDAAIRLLDQTGEQPLEVPDQPVDGRGVIEIGGVLDRAAELAVVLLEVEREVELRRRRLLAHRPQPQVLDLQAAAAGSVLQSEHHLDQGRVGEAPLRDQLLDQPFERHVLMGLGGELGLAHPAEQLAAGGTSRQVAAQDQVVDEEPDQPLELHPVAPGHRGAHREVVLAAVARQQGLEGGHQHHEERRSLAPAQGLGLTGETGRQAHRPLPAAEALHRGPRPVGGQLQDGRQAGELAPPPVDLPLQDLAVQPGTLPDREVRVLHRQLRQGRGLPLGKRGIELGHLAHQDAHRPAVARDVVHGEGDDMVRRVFCR